MKTRTLLLLSVAMAFAILMAGGIFLLQLSNESSTVQPLELGESTGIGDVTVTVLEVTNSVALLGIEIEIEGVDDADGIDNFWLVTGDRRLPPVAAPADGRCSEITVSSQQCRLDFDISAVETSSRVLVMRRGDQQRNWVLPER
ncbi:MAG: hypothetical protein KUG57_03420 [Ilumatobacteraceae bacterium]|nr:hypothetical protein [Ilumatobacteraceae bacterium]